MVSSLLHTHLSSLIGSSPTSLTPIARATHYHRRYSFGFPLQSRRNLQSSQLVVTFSQKNSSNSNCPTPIPHLKSLVRSSDSYTDRILGISIFPALAAALVILFVPNPLPAEAGFLSGITGLESVPGPELPRVEFLSKFNEENQKKYAEDDERIRSSPIIKQLLERSKQNKEKNKQEILDKYCLRGAEWGVGDCSTAGMTPDDRDAFIAMLKKKTEGSK